MTLAAPGKQAQGRSALKGLMVYPLGTPVLLCVAQRPGLSPSRPNGVVTLGESLRFSEPQFLPDKMAKKNSVPILRVAHN